MSIPCHSDALSQIILLFTYLFLFYRESMDNTFDLKFYILKNAFSYSYIIAIQPRE